MAIARDDLKELGFELLKPSKHPNGRKHEVWYYGEGFYDIWVGYDQGSLKYPHACAIDGDKDSLMKVCRYIIADANTAYNELEAGDDW